jgi:high affinity Mn2+ porin
LSDRPANLPGGAPLTGSTDLTNGFDLFKGNGSYFGGLRGEYNFALPQHVLGVEPDTSFQSLVAGTTVTSNGGASYGDTALYCGTVRGRVGYVFDNHWLLYGTGGLAWSYEQLKRTQLVDGALPAGTEEGAFRWRFGWAAGAGVEIPVAANWSARAEYLYTGFGSQSRTFVATPETFGSNLPLRQIRFGLNYKLFDDTPTVDSAALITRAPPAPAQDIWAVHGQSTLVSQYAAPFAAPYGGPNSLAANAGRETCDATAYLGLRLWNDAEAWINPEIDQGFRTRLRLGATRLSTSAVRLRRDRGGAVRRPTASSSPGSVGLPWR